LITICEEQNLKLPSPDLPSRSVEEDGQSETSEWELRERREREEERRADAEWLGAEVEERLFLPTPRFMAFAEEE
jgi:hypothetical protein